MKDKIIDALKTVMDPEVPVNIWDLGLVYDIALEKIASDAPNIAWRVTLDITMTSPTCPMAEDIMDSARAKIMEIPKVEDVEINLVWEPAWDISKMSEAAKVELDLVGMGW